MRFHAKICVLLGLAISLNYLAFAQCGHVSPAAGHAAPDFATGSVGIKPGGTEDRTVLLTLTVSKAGKVRDATVVQGPASLRAAAIKAAKARRYKHEITSWPFSREIGIEVKFPQNNGPPELRQAMFGGVPGCVYVSSVRVSPEVMQSRLRVRVAPVYTDQMAGNGILVLQVHVDKDGNVFKVGKVSGPDVAIPAAIDAVKKWKYEPYLLNGEPVEVATTVSLKVPE